MVNMSSSNDATQWKQGSQQFLPVKGVKISQTTRPRLSSRKPLVKNHLFKFAKQFYSIDSNFLQTQRQKWWELTHFIPSHTKSLKWEEFEKRFIRKSFTNNKKRQLSKDLIRKDQSNDGNIESTTVAGKVVDIANIRGSCQQIKWNVVNENSNLLILTIESESNQYICSLTNADLTSAYSHLCQYGEYSFSL